MAASIALPRYLFATVDLRDGVHLVSEEGAFELHYCALLTNEENKCVSAFARSDPGDRSHDSTVVVSRDSSADDTRRSDRTEGTVRRRLVGTRPTTIILDEPTNANTAMSSNGSPVETCAECGENVLTAYLDDDVCPACRDE